MILEAFVATPARMASLCAGLWKAGENRFWVLYKIQYLQAVCGDPARPVSLVFHLYPMVSNTAKEVFILGVTQDGRTFRPSDWAERLAGVMGQFRPGGQVPGSHLSYSPWCVPTSIGRVKAVVVHHDLREHEPMAWDFVMNFARDNELQVAEACLLPDAPR